MAEPGEWDSPERFVQGPTRDSGFSYGGAGECLIVAGSPESTNPAEAGFVVKLTER